MCLAEGDALSLSLGIDADHIYNSLPAQVRDAPGCVGISNGWLQRAGAGLERGKEKVHRVIHQQGHERRCLLLMRTEQTSAGHYEYQRPNLLVLAGVT